MMKTILYGLCLALLLATGAGAQTVTSTTGTETLTPAEAERALTILNDDQKRRELIDTLQTIAKAAAPATVPSPPANPTPPQAQPSPSPQPHSKAPATPAAPTLAPDSLGAELVVAAAGWATDLSSELLSVAHSVTNLPALWQGVNGLLSDATLRAQASEAILRLALVLGSALAAEALAALALRRPLARLGGPDDTDADADADADSTLAAAPAVVPAADAPASVLPLASKDAANWRLAQRLPLAFLRLAAALIPVAAFAAAGMLLAATGLASTAAIRLIVLEVVKAYVLCRGLIAVARMIAAPKNRGLRLLNIGDEAAAYVDRWAIRLAVVTVFGGTLAEAAQLLAWGEPVQAGLVKLVVFIDVVCLATIVVQCRSSIGEWIRAPETAHGPTALIRNRLAAVWHTIAIVGIAAIWFVWAVRQHHGLSRSLQLLLISVAVMIAARLATILVLGLFGRLFHSERPAGGRSIAVPERASRYYRLLRGLLGGTVAWIAVMILLQIWGVDAWSWIEYDAIGSRLASATVSIGVAAIAAVAVWEIVDAAIDRYVARLNREDSRVRSARVRTLAPILRSSLMIAILTIIALTVLSEIGVNIAPLVAGAGVVGIAIGFGSQKLVQDLITGLFLLLENAIQVGDWVTVSGLSGTVENLSIRTIRLRAGDGAVHIIPFSSVTSVTNSNRGIGNAAVSVNVAFEEDTDEVGQVLRQIAEEMRREPKFRSLMLGGLQLWGVDKVDGASVTIVGQIVCTDSGRWDVQREFNRRMKQRFHERGIVIAAPNQSVLVQSPRIAPLSEGDAGEPPRDRRASAS